MKPQWPLHVSKCIQLAGHYLGFNGWNTRIISVEKLGPKYVCTVELEIRNHHVTVTGSGCGEVHPISGLNDEVISKAHVAASSHHLFLKVVQIWFWKDHSNTDHLNIAWRIFFRETANRSTL